MPTHLVAPHVLALNGALGRQTVVSLSDLPTSWCVFGVFQLCLCILITTSDSAMSADNYILLGVGVFWACLTAAVGAVAVSAHPSARHLHHQPMRKIADRMYNKLSKAHMVKYTSQELWFLLTVYELLVVFQVLKESKALVWVFMVQNLPQVAFLVYLMYEVSFSLNLHEWSVKSASWSSYDERRQKGARKGTNRVFVGDCFLRRINTCLIFQCVLTATGWCMFDRVNIVVKTKIIMLKHYLGDKPIVLKSIWY